MIHCLAHRIVLASAILLLGGCELIGAFIGGVTDATSIEVVNRTDDPLYVTAWTQETLSYVRLAHEITAEPGDPDLLAPRDALNIDLEDLGDDFGSGDTAVFVVYAPIAKADNRYRLATMLHQSYKQLRRRSFRVPIRPGDLRYEHLFGHYYAILTEAHDHPSGVHPPYVEGDQLHVWVGFGGCAEGTFSLSEARSDDEAMLSIFHSYPNLEVDCRRYNYERLSFSLSDDVLSRGRVLLLNPNDDADPYSDAFLLMSDS